MEADSPIHLAAAPEKTAQRHVGFYRILVDFREFQEHLDGFVRLLIEQVVQTLKILVVEHLCALAGRTSVQ